MSIVEAFVMTERTTRASSRLNVPQPSFMPNNPRSNAPSIRITRSQSHQGNDNSAVARVVLNARQDEENPETEEAHLDRSHRPRTRRQQLQGSSTNTSQQKSPNEEQSQNCYVETFLEVNLQRYLKGLGHPGEPRIFLEPQPGHRLLSKSSPSTTLEK